MNEKDPLGIRSDFPALETQTYLDTPATALLPSPVAEAGIAFIRAQASGPIVVAEVFRKANEARAKFAALFGATEREVGFLFTTGEAENVLSHAIDFQPGDNVVIDDLHYTTAYVLYRSLESTRGIELRIVSSTDGRAGVEDYARHVDGRTRLISIAWVSNVNGYRHPLRELAALAHAHGALLYADAVQAIGAFPANLHDEGVDILSSGTYKWLLGGFGIAPFFIREEHLGSIRPDRLGAFSVREPLPGFEYRLHEGARAFEYGTLAFGPLYQLDASLDYLARVGLDRIEAHAIPLAREMRQGIVDRGFPTLTPAGNASPIVAFDHGRDVNAARALFESRWVRVSFRANGAQIRAGIALYNNRDDVMRFLDVVEELKSLPTA